MATATTERPISAAPPPAMRPLEFARWAWRQLTSMRIALILLFLLAVAAVPGSIFPQRRVDPLKVSAYIETHPALSPWLERLSMFDVYGSPWFGAVYLLLFVSLVGCVVPRSRQHLRAIRARPPAAPRHLDRLPEHRQVESHRDPAGVLDTAEAALRKKHYRVDRTSDTLAAERGHLRETGNLVFHLSMLLILVGAALGGLVGYHGTALVIEGESFADTITQYDDLTPGRLYDPADLPPFSLTLDDFAATYAEDGGQRGAARSFIATVTYRESPQEPEQRALIKVNDPLTIDGAKLHLLGHGYAPRFTVTDGQGDVVFQGPVAFLPQDPNFFSTGVVKVPDALPEQLGFTGFFLPTAVIDADRGPMSIFPGAQNPAVVLTAWKGDLGVDSGIPQSVYRLDTDQMEQVTEADGQPVRQILGAGQSMELPDGQGTIRYDGYSEWINLQVSSNPGLPVLLTGAVLAMVSVSLSLFIRRRRVWVRVAPARLAPARLAPDRLAPARLALSEGAGTVVSVAGLDRAHGGDLAAELDELASWLAEPPAEQRRRAAS